MRDVEIWELLHPPSSGEALLPGESPPPRPSAELLAALEQLGGGSMRERAPLLGLAASHCDHEDPRIRVTLAHLRSLQGTSRQLTFLPRQPARSVLNGQHASRLRGRGLNFEEMRDYLPGDDVRSIDWKATARTGHPFIKHYVE